MNPTWEDLGEKGRFLARRGQVVDGEGRVLKVWFQRPSGSRRWSAATDRGAFSANVQHFLVRVPGI